MIFRKLKDGNGGFRVVKMKFSFAAAALLVGTLFAADAIWFSDYVNAAGLIVMPTVEQKVVVLGAFGTYCGWLLGLVFAADVSDKWLNGGRYNQTHDEK